MNLIPNTPHKQKMLQHIQLTHIDHLFKDIPKKIQLSHLHLPASSSQQTVERHLRSISKKNQSCLDHPCFLGGGIKPHYIPPIVKTIVNRSEFSTAYTPYQAEASQGFLQAMFEYQSITAKLTGMDIANASLYDGMTALGEAALMCVRLTKKHTFLIPENISWEKKSVLTNYTRGHNITLKEITYDTKTGKIDLEELQDTCTKEVAGCYIENPNFFGIFEDDVHTIEEIVHANESIFVTGVDPLSLGVIKNPGEYAADVVIAEGRALGNHMSFGGSGLGIFACTKKFLRQLPGRIIGMTTDKDGKQAFCMTLQTREQHIRRGRATSNICTNEGLNALAAGVFLCWLGDEGLEELAEANLSQGQLLAKKITALEGFNLRFTGHHFNEFVIESNKNIPRLNKHLLEQGVHGGLPLEHWYPDLKNCLLFGITEIHTDEDINQLVEGLQGAA